MTGIEIAAGAGAGVAAGKVLDKVGESDEASTKLLQEIRNELRIQNYYNKHVTERTLYPIDLSPPFDTSSPVATGRAFDIDTRMRGSHLQFTNITGSDCIVELRLGSGILMRFGSGTSATDILPIPMLFTPGMSMQAIDIGADNALWSLYLWAYPDFEDLSRRFG